MKMETTRHFVATVYVVNNGATLLHPHRKLDMWLPPGGHVDRDELPHEAARREVREETGLSVELVAPREPIESETAVSLPKPQQFLLEDINVCGDEVGHQHVDFVYYGRAETRELDPADGEAPADDWRWFTPGELAARRGEFADDVVAVGTDAVETVDG